MVKPLLRNGAVVADLACQDFADLQNLHPVCVVQNAAKRHCASVRCVCRRLRLCGLFLSLLAEHQNPVPCHADNVGVVVFNHDLGGMRLSAYLRRNVEVRNILRVIYLAETRIDQLFAARPGRIIRVGNHLQFFGSIAPRDAEDSRDRNTLLAAGVRHCDALHILDDVSGAVHGNVAGLLTEELLCLGRRIRNGNRFCTSHRRNQFFPQNRGIITETFLMIGIHSNLLSL